MEERWKSVRHQPWEGRAGGEEPLRQREGHSLRWGGGRGTEPLRNWQEVNVAKVRGSDTGKEGSGDAAGLSSEAGLRIWAVV